jgi:hypothetical protein
MIEEQQEEDDQRDRHADCPQDAALTHRQLSNRCEAVTTSKAL